MNKIAFHQVKLQSLHFNEVLAGRKTHEIRFNDRDYQAGDCLILREVDDNGDDTGQEMNAEITHVQQGDHFGLADGWCVLSLANTTPLQGIRLIGYLRDRLKEHCDYIETQVPLIKETGHTTYDATRAIEAGRCWVDEANHFLKKFPVVEP
ncbi:DUF3850 domain-containing protein [Photobacterium galatheae]|uniref:DUF3850 domain-containing protein n=1 Tax=Photobacterium galatheae TaxID=1654360 RepID=A0A066RRE0_9GAMM|nr:DUF3850 domain-containing protein [Photobacterium galatheae]KDM90222.1 hypothetical protein EA58_18080 [Photobacterium galatheae]MCM0151515.1 DUF3850 domain-containing protein [Photobacterium galatheae]